MDAPCPAAFSRRWFLKAGSLALCAAALPAQVMAQAESYYLANRTRLLDEFSGIIQGVRAALAPHSDRTEAVAKAAEEAYAALLPTLPELGGDANRNTEYLLDAACLAALHQGMRASGFSAADSGRLFYDLCVAQLRQTPPDALASAGAYFFSQEGFDEMARWAQWTQLRTHPGDWVARVWRGTDGSFDIACEYQECGAVKLFASLGLADVAPYFCINDFPRSRLEGTGLVRTGTLAMGRPVCDFRYAKGRTVTQDWDTEVHKLS